LALSFVAGTMSVMLGVTVVHPAHLLMHLFVQSELHC
jgi:hypothetical protein